MTIRREDLGSEVGRSRQYAQFRDPDWRKKREPKWKTRDGMDSEHLENIRQLPCATCSDRRWKVHAHHLRYGGAVSQRGIGRKAPDAFAVPVCFLCHSSVHERGSRREEEWWRQRGFNGEALAKRLWSNKHCLKAMSRVLLAHRLEAIHTIALREKHRG